MNKRITASVISLLLLSASFIASGQKTVNEATLSYQIAIVNASGGSMGSATLTVYVKGNQSRADMTSSLGNESAIFDNKQGKGAILKEYSGQKLMISMTQDNWNQKNQLFRNLSFIQTGKQDQSVGNFTCRPAEAKTPEGKLISVCYLPDVQLVNTQYSNAFSRLAGIPVQFELESGALRFRYTLSDLNYDPVPAAKFELPKSGYRLMSYEDSQQLKKGSK